MKISKANYKYDKSWDGLENIFSRSRLGVGFRRTKDQPTPKYPTPALTPKPDQEEVAPPVTNQEDLTNYFNN